MALRLSGTRVDRGGVVMKRFLRIRTTARVGVTAIALSALIAVPAHASVSGILTGYPSPAGGSRDIDKVVNVTVSGNSSASALDDATLTVGGIPVGGADFACKNEGCSVGDATIGFNTESYTDGVYHLVATVRNASGETNTAEGNIEIWNNRGQNCSPRCSADLSIGSDPTAAPPATNPGTKPGGGVEGANESSCLSPRLSMSLAEKPLRVSHGVPVLLKNKTYRFTGRLTCLVNNKRRSAAKGTRIDVRNTIGRKTVRKASGKVGNGGKITVQLKYSSSRTIEFRFTNADGKSSKVRIKVRIAQRKSQ
jgi:hypothetical protein